MPARGGLPALSEVQLEIMHEIWERGECSIGEVWRTLHERRGVSRNTIHTLIVRLEEKGWLTGRSYTLRPFHGKPLSNRSCDRSSTRSLRARPRDWCWRCSKAARCRRKKPSGSGG